MEPTAATAVAIAAVLIGFAIFVLVFQLIWNWTVPAVFGLKRITFLQALGSVMGINVAIICVSRPMGRRLQRATCYSLEEIFSNARSI